MSVACSQPELERCTLDEGHDKALTHPRLLHVQSVDEKH